MMTIEELKELKSYLYYALSECDSPETLIDRTIPSRLSKIFRLIDKEIELVEGIPLIRNKNLYGSGLDDISCSKCRFWVTSISPGEPLRAEENGLYCCCCGARFKYDD